MEWISSRRDRELRMGGECMAIRQQCDREGERRREREHDGGMYCECVGRSGNDECRMECRWRIGEQYCTDEHWRDRRRDGDDCG